MSTLFRISIFKTFHYTRAQCISCMATSLESSLHQQRCLSTTQLNSPQLRLFTLFAPISIAHSLSDASRILPVTLLQSIESIMSCTFAMFQDVQRAKVMGKDTVAMTSSLSTCGGSMRTWGTGKADRSGPEVRSKVLA